jgi:hypothetical protein
LLHFTVSSTPYHSDALQETLLPISQKGKFFLSFYESFLSLFFFFLPCIELFFSFIYFVIFALTCVYVVWATCSFPLIPYFQAKSVLPSCSLILLKRNIRDNKKDTEIKIAARNLKIKNSKLQLPTH